MNAQQLLAQFDRISEAPEAIPRLRRFILDLAVRGKLVEQDPNDEPVSHFLARIEAEQARLVKERQIKPVERFDSVATDEIPFQIPSGWAIRRMGWLARKFGAGSTPLGGKSVYQSEGVPFLRSQNVYDNGLRLADVALIARAIHERMSGTHVQPNDLLLNITGASIGRCALVPSTFGEGNVSQHVAIIRLFDPAIREFIHMSLTSPFFQRMIDDVQVGVSREGLSMQRFRLFPMLLPPLPEQHRIVAKVDELMHLCDRLEAAQGERERTRDRLVAASLQRLNQPADPCASSEHVGFHLQHFPRLTVRPEQIAQLRQTILNLAVRGKLVPQDPEDEPAPSFDVPDGTEQNRLTLTLPPGWSWARVNDVAESRLGKMLDGKKNSGNPYRYLRNTNVHWFDIRLVDLKTMRIEDSEIDSFLLRDGDVLICEGGHGIGRTAVWRNSPTDFVFQKALHRARPGPLLESDFFAQCVFVYFHAGILQTYYTGVGIPHFTGMALSKLVFPLPPRAEQHRIVAKVDELMALCDRLEAQLTTAQTESRRLLEAVLHEALAPAT